uniref:Placenta associated 8 n=1 Tax=Sus scrofa TaxID=9823 RepID=A0A8D0T8X2_PIG
MNPVVSQPRYGAGGTAVSDWQSGVFDCCDDMGICICGTFFPLCLSCQIASDMNECCLCGASVAMRTMYRTRYGIPVSPRPPPPAGSGPAARGPSFRPAAPP